MKQHFLYKIYYKNGDNDECVYVGRTNQPLQNRLRGHFFKKPMQREINIFLVSKVEYSELKTEADMFLYEIYYINLLKPVLNKDDKSPEPLTISLPEINFTEYIPPLMDKWKDEITEIDKKEEEKRQRANILFEHKRDLRAKFHKGEITEEEYYNLIENDVWEG